MGTLHRLPVSGQTTLGQAADHYLATLAGSENQGTRRVYTNTIKRLLAEFGPDVPLAEIDPDAFAGWFTSQWEDCAPATWNGALACYRAAAQYWAEQGWLTHDPSGLLRRRKPGQDRDRALSEAEVERLLTNDRYPLRDRLLWRMLYETATRSAEILRLDVPDLDMPNRRTRVTRKGRAQDAVYWQSGTARLLPRYLKGRASGPLFLTSRRARSDLGLSPADIDPSTGRARLSYQQAEQLFKEASGGATLHQLRHSALTHDAERGTGAPMLQARSGHANLQTLGKYARVSAAALARHMQETDPARRR